MTKEMRPAHRVDVLTHALLHYKRCVTENIGTVLNFYTQLGYEFCRFTAVQENGECQTKFVQGKGEHAGFAERISRCSV